MKKSSDVKNIIRLQKGIMKIGSKRHCKLSRNKQRVLYEVNGFLERSKRRKIR